MLHISFGLTAYILCITFFLGLLSGKLCGLPGHAPVVGRVGLCRTFPL